MATKWRNLIKTAALAVLVVSFCMTFLGLVQLSDKRVIFKESFEEVDWELDAAFGRISSLLEMKNEEFIASGGYLLSRNTENSLRQWSKEEIDRVIKRDLSEYRSNLKRLDTYADKHIYYYAQDGDVVLANMEYPRPEQFESYILYEGSDDTSMIVTPAYSSVMGAGAGDKIFVAYDNEYVYQMQEKFAADKATAYDQLEKILLIALPGVLALIILIWLAGGSLAIDKVWNEVILAAILAVMVGYLAFLGVAFKASAFVERPMFFHAISTAFLLTGTGLLLMFVRNIKNGRLIRGTLIYAVYMAARRGIRTLLNLTPLNIKLCGMLLAGMFVVFLAGAGAARDGFFCLLAIMAAVAVIWVILKYVIRPYDDEVKARLEREIDAKMKSERLKTELITNVSHDLKTPLTAILNYSDLLLKKSPKDDYARTINEKAQKLRALTEDLFDVSKAQSGNIDVELETLDLAELISQTLAEIDDKNVEFKIDLKEHAFIADGTLMSRVFGNLAGNIVKYSLPGTRAYISSVEMGGKTVITFKNIANYEMNFDADEIAERFKRGDSSRATEGNGLGLAIAKSYTEACGGEFDIDIDGDLFKVTIRI